MNSHQLRFIGIALLTGLLFCIEGYLMATGKFASVESAALGGSLAILLPALIDASAVERRRRDKCEKAIGDDIEVEHNEPSERPTARPKVRRIPAKREDVEVEEDGLE